MPPLIHDESDMYDAISLDAKLGHPRILVIGDAMLDRYTWGTAERVSPEAPVLVLRADEREVRLGGAASVAVLLRGLEVEVTLASVVGDDHDGRTLRRLIDEAAIDSRCMFVDTSRPTTTKDRFLGGSDHRQPHQMLRVDTESREPLSDELTGQLLDSFSTILPHHSAVLISDYAKGVCTKPFLAAVIERCRAMNIPVLIDPSRGTDFAWYRRATLLKPNRLEAELAVGGAIRSPEEALTAAHRLRERYEIETVVITLDQDGLVFASSETAEHLPISARSICDITGAGDMVLATLGLSLSAQLPMHQVAQLANVAAGLQVQQPGVTPVPRTTLLYEFQRLKPRCSAADIRPVSNHSKIVSFEAAEKLANEYRTQRQTIVFTNGCFDLLHLGHLTMLEEAAGHGDVLFVAINSDQSVRRLKGADRPVIGDQERAQMLAALSCVDHVLIFGDATPHRLLSKLRPDVLVKGGTTSKIIGQETVERYGGRVEWTGELNGHSTTALLAQISSHSALKFQKEVS